MRAKGKVGVQHDFQDFRGSVQRGHLVSDLHFWVEPGLASSRGEKSHAGFLGSNGQLFPICPPHQGRIKLVRPCLSLNNVGSRVKSLAYDMQHKVVKEG